MRWWRLCSLALACVPAIAAGPAVAGGRMLVECHRVDARRSPDAEERWLRVLFELNEPRIALYRRDEAQAPTILSNDKAAGRFLLVLRADDELVALASGRDVRSHALRYDFESGALAWFRLDRRGPRIRRYTCLEIT